MSESKRVWKFCLAKDEKWFSTSELDCGSHQKNVDIPRNEIQDYLDNLNSKTHGLDLVESSHEKLSHYSRPAFFLL